MIVAVSRGWSWRGKRGECWVAVVCKKTFGGRIGLKGLAARGITKVGSYPQ